jgi:transketolase
MAKYDFGRASSREQAGEAIYQIGEKSDKVFCVTSDVGLLVKKFREAHPNNYVDTGIAEQNGASIAAGLALEGYKPYIVGMIPFMTMRAFEQVRTDICYQNLPVTILGTGGGLVSTGGATHNCMEDVSLMRTLVNMSVVSVSDPLMIHSFIHQSFDWDGPLFIRQAGGKSDRILYSETPGDYPLGKGLLARPGKDVTVIAHGSLVAKALDAAEEVASQGIDVRVIDMYSIKPLDEQMIIAAIEETGNIIVAEDHLRRGGLSSAVAELIVDEGVYPKNIVRLGIPDVYAGYGPESALQEALGYGQAAILENIKAFAG